ncbi:MAG: ABC transporter permease [Candidatus Aminicenantes bacterium]|nr:MAG: ABC transporter permease [Candidatus Aminicenantes bacterium]
MLNATAVKAMGLEDPIGKPLTINRRKGTVIGVIKDYHFQTLNQKIGPLCLFNSGENSRYLFARVSPQNLDATIGFIRSEWNKFDSLRYE